MLQQNDQQFLQNSQNNLLVAPKNIVKKQGTWSLLNQEKMGADNYVQKVEKNPRKN